MSNPVMQSHIEEILQAIQHIASGDFSYRAPLYNREEGLDAIALGINMLGEEIEAKINAHMQQNKTLNLLTAKFSSITRASTAAIIMMDAKEIISFWNQAAEKIFGITSEYAVGKELYQLIVPERYRQSYQMGHKRFLENSSGEIQNQNLELVAKRKSGEEFPIELSFSSVQLEGEFNTIGFVREMTERKIVDEALRQSEALLNATQRLAKIGGWKWDIEKETMFWTDEVYRIHDFERDGFDTVEDLIKRSSECYDPEDRPVIMEAFKRCRDEGEAYDLEFPFTSANGHRKWIRTITEPVYKDDKIVMIVGNVMDITERKQAEETLINSGAKHTALIKNISDVIAIVDKSGINRYKSPNIEKWFGWKPKELIGEETWKNIHPEDLERIQFAFGKILQKDNSMGTVEYRYLCRDGSYKWVGATATNRMADKNINGVLLNYRDISDRKQAEKERITLEGQLRQSQKLEALGTMVGGISHELNNVLQSMFLYGSLIAEELPDNDMLQSHLQHLFEGGERAKDIIKQILTFSRKSEINMKPQYLHELVIDALSLVEAMIPANIEIKQDIDTNCAMVLCDKTQIHQAMINLCNNAQYAMQKVGGLLSVNLKQTSAWIEGNNSEIEVIELTVSDTGHGIDTPDLERIFDPFFTTKEFGQGTGLGLSVIHGIVKMMNGQIKVTSKVGEGSKFTIHFPVTHKVIENLGNKSSKDSATSGNRILLVDDETSIRFITRTILAKENFNVDEASNGKQALELIKANPQKYDLIVTDLLMPEMSGVELSQEIRNFGSDIPIILSTGQLGVEDKKEYNDMGITSYIQKPWTPEELIEQIRELDE